MNAAETILRAVEIAERLNHCKGRAALYADGERVACCLLGAVMIARDEAADMDETTPAEAFEFVEAEVGKVEGGSTYLRPAARWNDLPTTTKDDVIGVLKRAAAKAEAAGI